MAYSYSKTAPMIQVRWAETDLSLFPTHPLYPGANPTNHLLRGGAIGPLGTVGAIKARQASSGLLPGNSVSGTVPPVTRPTQTQSGRNGEANGPTEFPKFGSTKSGGLSSGAKAGIGIGVTLGVLLILGAVGFLFWRTRRAKRNSDAPVDANTPSGMPHPGMAEVDNTGRYEMPSHSTTVSPTVVGSELGVPTPPPPALLGYEKGEKVELPSHSPPPHRGALGSELDAGQTWSNYHPTTGAVSELHGQDRPPYSELSPESRPAEMDGTQQPFSSQIARKQVGGVGQPIDPGPIFSTVDEGPDTGVFIMPGTHAVAAPPPPLVSERAAELSPEEMAVLMKEHEELEKRRQRILELEKIERAQAALKLRIGTIRGEASGN